MPSGGGTGSPGPRASLGGIPQPELPETFQGGSRFCAPCSPLGSRDLRGSGLASLAFLERGDTLYIAHSGALPDDIRWTRPVHRLSSCLAAEAAGSLRRRAARATAGLREWGRGLELLLEPRLPQHPIRRVARLDLAVDGEVSAGLGTMPDVMVPATAANEGAPASRSMRFSSGASRPHEGSQLDERGKLAFTGD